MSEHTSNKIDEVHSEFRDELARTLRDGYAAIINEADDWRPLADHVVALLVRERTDATAEFLRLQRVDKAFHDLAVKERDAERKINEKLRAKLTEVETENEQFQRDEAEKDVDYLNLRTECDQTALRLAEASAEVERWRTLREANYDTMLEIQQQRDSLRSRLAEAEKRVAYYESVLTLPEGALVVLEGGVTTKAIEPTRVADLVARLAEAEAERDKERALKAVTEAKRDLERKALAESQAREARLRAALEEARFLVVNAEPSGFAALEPVCAEWSRRRTDFLRGLDESAPACEALDAIREAMEHLDTMIIDRAANPPTLDAMARTLAVLVRLFGEVPR